MNELEKRMQAKGFHLIDTGGNCTAYANDDESRLITRQTDPEAPDSLTDPITVGTYAPEYEGSKNFDNVEAFLNTYSDIDEK